MAKPAAVQSADILAPLLAVFRACVKEAAAEAVREERRAFAEEDAALYRRLSEINAKVHVTIPEAALLLNCSDSHLYKLVGKARRGKSKRPIPYLDLEGVTVLPRLQLLEWARPAHLRAVEKEAEVNLVTLRASGLNCAPDSRRSCGVKGGTA